MQKGNFINGQWRHGEGDIITSFDSATQEILWQGKSASSEQISNAIYAATQALPAWKAFTVSQREQFLHNFVSQLDNHKEELAKTISQEVGKPLWESHQEVEAIKNKIAISIHAYKQRCKDTCGSSGVINVRTSHHPHGVVAVFGPFNFPGHLPQGHIVPALLAGNAVVFKPSEKSPKTGQFLAMLWEKAAVPPAIFTLLQGDKTVAREILNQSEISGIFFTGSYAAGRAITEHSLNFPNRIVALEMGGNNPLVVSHVQNQKAALFTVLQSAFTTSGQRCTAARRLILIENEQTNTFLNSLITATKNIVIGTYRDTPEPFMGPVIDAVAAQNILAAQNRAVKRGGKVLLEAKIDQRLASLVTPGIIDMTGCTVDDEEIFGPLLQCIRVKNLEQAIIVANNTQYGLATALLSDSESEYEYFFSHSKAGIINWNSPTTGASSWAPFGGLGKSGNFRPSAYYAADYSCYPVASQENKLLTLPEKLPPGILLK